jgi:hypothetical protein
MRKAWVNKEAAEHALWSLLNGMAESAKADGKKYVPVRVDDLLQVLENYQDIEMTLEDTKQNPQPVDLEFTKDLRELVYKYKIINPQDFYPRG